MDDDILNEYESVDDEEESLFEEGEEFSRRISLYNALVLESLRRAKEELDSERIQEEDYDIFAEGLKGFYKNMVLKAYHTILT